MFCRHEFTLSSQQPPRSYHYLSFPAQPGTQERLSNCPQSQLVSHRAAGTQQRSGQLQSASMPCRKAPPRYIKRGGLEVSALTPFTGQACTLELGQSQTVLRPKKSKECHIPQGQRGEQPRGRCGAKDTEGNPQGPAKRGLWRGGILRETLEVVRGCAGTCVHMCVHGNAHPPRPSCQARQNVVSKVHFAH